MDFVPLYSLSDYNCFAHGHPNKFYEPRLLVQMALEDEKLAIEVKELGLGITDLVIKQHDNGNVTLKVLIGVGPSVEPLFHLGTWDKCHLRGIDITLEHYGKEQKGRVPGLFEIGRVGFYGYEIKEHRWQLFTPFVESGTLILLEMLFDLFPGFLQHIYLSIPKMPFNTLLYGLANSRKLEKVKELTCLRKMTEQQVAIVKKSLRNSEKINFA